MELIDKVTAKRLIQVLPVSQTTIYRYISSAKAYHGLEKHQYLTPQLFSIWLYNCENKDFIEKLKKAS